MRLNNLFKNKKGFGARDYFIALILFGSVISLIAIMVSSSASEYGSTGIVDSNFESKYSRTTEYTNTINASLSSLKDKEGLSAFTTGVAVFKATLAFVQLLLNSLGFISEPTYNFIGDFNVPTQVASVLFISAISIIVITIVLRILGSVSNRQP